MILRAQEFVDGDDIEWSAELPRLKIVMAVLVEAGVVAPDDWHLDAPLLPHKIRDLGTLRLVIEGKILGRMELLNQVERKIVMNLVPRLSQLVFEMAAAVLCHEIVVNGFEEYFESPPKSDRLLGGRDVFLSDLRNTRSYLSPEEHLKQARSELDVARRECDKARKRVAYEKSKQMDRGDGGVGSGMVPEVVVVGTSASKLRKAYIRDKQDLFSVVQNEESGRVVRLKK